MKKTNTPKESLRKLQNELTQLSDSAEESSEENLFVSIENANNDACMVHKKIDKYMQKQNINEIFVRALKIIPKEDFYSSEPGRYYSFFLNYLFNTGIENNKEIIEHKKMLLEDLCGKKAASENYPNIPRFFLKNVIKESGFLNGPDLQKALYKSLNNLCGMVDVYNDEYKGLPIICYLMIHGHHLTPWVIYLPDLLVLYNTLRSTVSSLNSENKNFSRHFVRLLVNDKKYHSLYMADFLNYLNPRIRIQDMQYQSKNTTSWRNNNLGSRFSLFELVRIHGNTEEKIYRSDLIKQYKEIVSTIEERKPLLFARYAAEKLDAVLETYYDVWCEEDIQLRRGIAEGTDFQNTIKKVRNLIAKKDVAHQMSEKEYHQFKTAVNCSGTLSQVLDRCKQILDEQCFVSSSCLHEWMKSTIINICHSEFRAECPDELMILQPQIEEYEMTADKSKFLCEYYFKRTLELKEEGEVIKLEKSRANRKIRQLLKKVAELEQKLGQSQQKEYNAGRKSIVDSYNGSSSKDESHSTATHLSKFGMFESESSEESSSGSFTPF